MQYIQANSPVIGSYAYHHFWTGIVPQYLYQLELQHPECAFWDQRPLNDADYEALRQYGEAQVERMRELSEMMQ